MDRDGAGHESLRRTVTSPAGGRRPGDVGIGGVRVRRLTTADLTDHEVAALRALLWSAFAGDDEDGFSEDDWSHAIGGLHFLLDHDGELVAHASVVERELHVGERPIRTGYVEAVATDPRHHGRGLGSQVMADVGSYIRDGFALGALATGRHAFYERLGWLRWVGPTSVRTATGTVRTPTDDGYILVLLTPTSGDIDRSTPISCDWRPGDVW